MDFQHSPRALELQERLKAFMDEHIYPNEETYREQLDANIEAGRPNAPVPLVDELKARAREAGLWNLFMPDPEYGPGLTNLEYGPLCEIMGHVGWSSAVFNCSAPDTGNMELLARFGTEEQKERWLKPLLAGEIRSSFAMTEPLVASSDATNIETRIERDGDEYVINGRKWFISGACAERCEFFILMGKTDPDKPNRHRQQSQIIVPKNTPGVTILRDMSVFGGYSNPGGHPEILFENVRVPASNIILGEGRGFEIAQARLGPGRIHLCMRTIGVAERALSLLCDRITKRVAFGRKISDHGVWRERIAESRMMIDQARWLVLNAAYMMDTVGNKEARKEIAMIKVVAPNAALQVIDWAIQAHGAAGYSKDFPLAAMYASIRTIRTADGPDEVHRNAIAKAELKPYLEKNA